MGRPPMTASEAGEGLAAVLLQISEHAERLGLLDAREGEHYQAVSEALAKLHTTVAGLRSTVADQAEILGALEGIDETLAVLGAKVASLMPTEAAESDRYHPIPTVVWWSLDEEEREAARARIRDWVQRILVPYYGHLAKRLGDCWDRHPLCLVQLDWLSELWSVLHLQPERSARDLAAQAELGIRILPAVAEQLAAETTACQHARALNGRRLPTGTWAR
jgi:hypothetical protein